MLRGSDRADFRGKRQSHLVQGIDPVSCSADADWLEPVCPSALAPPAIVLIFQHTAAASLRKSRIPFETKLNKQPLGLPAYRPALEQQPGGGVFTPSA